MSLPSQLTSAGFNPSDTSGTNNTVAGTLAASLFNDLPGHIDRGNLRLLTTDFGGGFTESVDTTYKPVTSNGLSGLVDTVTTSVTAPGYGTETAPSKSFTYWSKGATPTPLVATETVDAPGAELDLVTTYARDARGRVTSTTLTGFTAPGMGGASVVGALNDAGMQHVGSFVASDVSSFNDVFDLPLVTRNAVPYQHATTMEYHPFLGLPTSVTGPNGANDRVTTEYDALGRVTKVTKHLTNEVTQNTFAWDSGVTITPPTDGVAPGRGITGVSAVAVPSKFRMLTTVTAKPAVTTWFDRLGRPLRVQKEGFGSLLVKTDTGYNSLGQAVATTNPYASGSPFWTTTRYDALGRVKDVTAPNGTVTTNTYLGRATRVEVNAANFGGRDPAPQVNATVVDAKGRTVKVWNADNVPSFSDNFGTTATAPSIEFKLDGFGRMRRTLLKDQTQEITATYDALGRQTSLDDPDKGLWSYVNNALGQVVKQTDARLNVTRSTFDRLGRPLQRRTEEASAGPVETATWSYYDATASTERQTVLKGDKGWIGALHREESSTTGAPGYAGANSPTSRVLTYNAQGLPDLDLTAIDGKVFHTQTVYDANARPWKVRHYWKPAGAEDPAQQPYVWQDFGYTYGYDAKSYVTTVTDSLGRSWWDTPIYDHLDRVTSVRKGSGHTTTRVYRPEDGMLTSISTGSGGSIQNLSFGFDGLGNLVSRTLSGVPETFDYDILNRLTHRNAGVIATYADNGNILTKQAVDGNPVSLTAYHASKPHAVITATYNSQTLNQGYDANGNVSSRTFGTESWQFKYPGFDKPRWMAKTVGSAVTGSEFLYNANRSRVLHLEFDQFTTEPSHYVRKRIYAMGPTLELNYQNTSPSATTWALDKVRIYVPGPDGTIGSREWDIAVTPGWRPRKGTRLSLRPPRVDRERHAVRVHRGQPRDRRREPARAVRLRSMGAEAAAHSALRRTD